MRIILQHSTTNVIVIHARVTIAQNQVGDCRKNLFYKKTKHKTHRRREEIMKPWLNEILLCPIDRHFPLKVTAFKIENEAQAIKTLESIESMCKDLQWFFQEDGNEEESASNRVVRVNQVGDKILVFDALIRKPVLPRDYLKGILHSIDELKHVSDARGGVVQDVIDRLVAFEKQCKDAFDHLVGRENDLEEVNACIKKIEPDIILLNWVKQILEIEEGLLVCSACNRWFPIRSSIPQLLPDELRKEKFDKEFLEQWKDSIPGGIVRSGLPFNLHDG